MKILMVHPGASWSTADVHNGLRFGLSACGAQTANYQLDVRIARSARWLHWNWRQSGRPGDKPNARDIQYHAGEGLVTRALRIEPDWVLIVSGMYLDIEIVRHLRKAGLRIAVLLTESPYDDLAQAEFIRLAHVAWTHERTSLPLMRAAAPETQVGYIAHAWHPAVHVPQAPHPDTPKHDVLFVGTGFPERVQMLRDADLGDRLALYGHWDCLGSRNRLRRHLRGAVVDNERATELYRAATVNLNLMRRRQGWGGAPGTELPAESVNPRIMELAACGRFFLTDYRPEMDDIFGAGTIRNLTFETGAELREQVDGWLAASDGARQAVADELHHAVRDHSWVHRAETIMADLRAHPTHARTDGNAGPRLHLADEPVGITSA